MGSDASYLGGGSFFILIQMLRVFRQFMVNSYNGIVWYGMPVRLQSLFALCLCHSALYKHQIVDALIKHPFSIIVFEGISSDLAGFPFVWEFNNTVCVSECCGRVRYENVNDTDDGIISMQLCKFVIHSFIYWHRNEWTEANLTMFSAIFDTLNTSTEITFCTLPSNLKGRRKKHNFWIYSFLE